MRDTLQIAFMLQKKGKIIQLYTVYNDMPDVVILLVVTLVMLIAICVTNDPTFWLLK